MRTDDDCTNSAMGINIYGKIMNVRCYPDLEKPNYAWASFAQKHFGGEWRKVLGRLRKSVRSSHVLNTEMARL